MKLKPLVASMLALTASAGVAFASSHMSARTTNRMDAMKAKIAKMEAILDQNQSQAYSFADMPMKSWANRVTVSGLLGVDAAWSGRTAADALNAAAIWAPGGNRHFSGRFTNNESMTALDLNVANLYFDAEVNCYTTAHVALSYTNQNDYRFNDHPEWSGSRSGGVYLDEGYVTISNFAKTPVYFRAGRQNVDFGNYYRWPITATFTQMLSETQANAAATLGYVDASGLSGSVYMFKGTNTANVAPANRNRLNNGGVHLQYAGSYNNVGFKIAADYINNMSDAWALSAAATNNNRSGGLSVHADASYAQFDATVDWVMALKGMQNIIWDNQWNQTIGSLAAAIDAKPKAVNVELGYSFNTMGLPSRVAAGYQHSWQALGLPIAMPESRIVAQYGVELGRNTDLTLQVVHDMDYDTNDLGGYQGINNAGNAAVLGRAGTNRSATTVVARLGVRFA